MKEERAVKLVKETFGNSFREEKFVPFIKNLLNEVDQDKPSSFDGRKIPDSYKKYINQYKRIAQYTDPKGEKLDVLSVSLKREISLKRARTMQRNFVGWYLKSEGYSKDSALVAFYHEDSEDWRFSYVKRGYKLAEHETGKIKIKEELTPTRRFSFLVGENEPSHTAQNQIVPILENDRDNPTLSGIETAFDVEAITDEFFEKYSDLLKNLEKQLNEIVEKDDKVKTDFEKKEVHVSDFAKKLLSQIVFLYFLQKKGWFGVKRGEEWGSGSKWFLRELFEKKHGSYENFFNDILEPLFYEALGSERSGDYYSRFDCRIPFLNGGLFDPINEYDWIETEILLPNEMFYSGHTNTKDEDSEGILDVFDRYNFTVKEDEPLEREVAVDPEMLGKVFENFLEVKDRKSKGTYYTPRKIVYYMCQESLINYLNTEFNDSINRNDFERLVRYGESFVESANGYSKRKSGDLNGKEAEEVKLAESILQNAELIDEKLASVRVCDPAVGSGAFVVGMMNEIVRTRNALTPYLQDTEERTSYNFKRNAIQNCLYGVDIDSGAVEIAKLRLWLSLIVDEKERANIQPLPNLDYKIVKGDSLIGYQFIPLGLEKIEKLKEEFFGETRHSEKERLKKEIDEAMTKLMENTEKALGYKVNFDFKIFFSEIFREKTGFDMVIGNPPYVQLQKMKNNPVRKTYQKQGYKTYDSMGDIYCLFYEKGVKIIRNGGVLCYISSNKWMRAGYGEKLRNFFLVLNPLILIDLGSDVFKTATVDTNILLVQKSQNQNLFKGLTIVKDDDFEIEDKVNRESVTLTYLADEPWSVRSQAETKLKQKIESMGTPLKEKEWGISINYGIKTGLNRDKKTGRGVFIIDNETKEELIKEDPKSGELIKPLLRGRDINRYRADWNGLWLIDTHNGYGDIPPISIENYKAIKRHLDKFYPELEKRRDKGITPYNLRNCAYHAEFEKEKIIYPNMTKFLPFVYDNKNMYTNQKCFIITGKDLKYLLGWLNSKIFRSIFRDSFPELQGGTRELSKIFFKKIPVPIVTENNKKISQAVEFMVDKILAAKKVDISADTTIIEDEIDQLFYRLYALNREEIQLIEKRI